MTSSHPFPSDAPQGESPVFNPDHPLISVESDDEDPLPESHLHFKVEALSKQQQKDPETLDKAMEKNDEEASDEDWVDVVSEEDGPSLLSNPKRILKDGTLEEIAELVRSKKAKRILVVAGAGISTSSGIPDFRSPKTGLYHNLKKYNLPEPEAIFDIDFFLENPKPFFTLAKELYPTNFAPTLSHFFVKLLADKKLLLKMMTQNIDTLEAVAGIPSHLLCEAHGTFASAHCVGCKEEQNVAWLREKIFEAEALPYCSRCGSLVKPDIVFFGEALPPKFYDAFEVLGTADLVLVMGTSLKVGPFNSIIDHVSPTVPRLLINKVKVGELRHPRLGFDFDGTHQPYFRDVFVQGSCDEIILKFSELLGWKDELLTLQREFQLSSHLSKIHIETHENQLE